MKNIAVWKLTSSSVEFGCDLLANDIKGCIVDSFNNVYFAFTHGVYCYPKKHFVQYPADDGEFSFNEIASFNELYDENAICIVYTSRAVVLIRPEADMAFDIFCLKLIDASVDAASWSPGCRCLIAIAGNNIFRFSSEFQLEESALLVKDHRNGRDELVTLGWGSRETQFQGAGARKAMKETDDETWTDLWSYDEGNTLISWTGDAAYFAVSYCDNGIRKISIWSENLEFISCLKPLKGLENVLSYKPSGSVIAVSRLKDAKRSIVFFERNGELRSQFEVEEEIANNNVSWIGWNSDSSILSIRYTNLKNHAPEDVQFWYISNFRWKLKYRMQFIDGLLYSGWSNVSVNTFNYVSNDGSVHSVTFDFVYNVHNGIAIVVSGRCLQISDYHIGIIPPPMYHYRLELSDTVCGVSQSTNGAAFLSCDQTVHIYGLRDRKYVPKTRVALFDVLKSTSLRCTNIAIRNDRIVALVHKCSGGVNVLAAGGVNEFGTWHNVYSSDDPVAWLLGLNSEEVILQSTTTHEVSILGVDGFTKFPSAQYRGASREHLYRRFVFVKELGMTIGLSLTNELIVNGNVVCGEVTSFAVCDQFCLMTINNMFFTSRLKDLVLRNYKITDHAVSRMVEHGALLLGYNLEAASVFMQIPRGNIETIHLRILLINRLKEMMDSLKYKESMTLMRRHRIDLNLLVDHNPENFLRNVDLFIQSVHNDELINQFILSLNDDDVTTGMYAYNYSTERSLPRTIIKDKVNVISKAVRSTVLSLDKNMLKNLFTVVLSSYVKATPPLIVEALHQLSAEVEHRTDYPDDDISQLKRDWIGYIGCLVPQENLFNEALGTYDLSLANDIAQFTCQDPKEYVSLLVHYQSLVPEAYRHYKIDVYLERYDRALENIAKVDEKFDEALELIETHQLYLKALSVFNVCRNNSKFNRICNAAADFLAKKGNLDEAISLYVDGGNFEAALSCAVRNRDYSSYKDLAVALKMPLDEMNSVMLKMFSHFKNIGRYNEAANVLRLLNDETKIMDAVECYCHAHCWNEAEKLVKQTSHHVKDTTAAESRIILAEKVRARFEQLIEFIKKSEADIEQYLNRLHIVRRIKKEDIENFLSSNLEDDEVLHSEILSDVSSTSSNLSKTSGNTVIRRKKRIDKKKTTLKEGSSYEDAALLNAIKSVISNIDKSQDELHSFLRVMIYVKLFMEARDLQRKYVAVISFALKSIASAWPNQLVPHLLIGPWQQIYRREDGLVMSPSEIRMPDKVSLDSELFAPVMRSNLSWQLQLLNDCYYNF